MAFGLGLVLRPAAADDGAEQPSAGTASLLSAVRRVRPSRRIRGPEPERDEGLYAAFLPLRLEASSSSRMIRTAMRIWAGVCSEVMKNLNRAAFSGTAG